MMPCTEKRARLLLERGRARVHKVMPFTIRVVDLKAEDSEFQALRIKLDPGSKTTGIALVREAEEGVVAVLNLFELIHRGKQISEALTARRGHRRLRRSKLRYRAPRFLNRGNKAKGWLAPSLQHRVDTTLAWVRRLERLDRASRNGPWTRSALAIIDRRPGVRAAELAHELGRETPAFKRDVRKLKELGLTESLPTGYRLSPRARALMRRS